jgi:hypothetical protein
MVLDKSCGNRPKTTVAHKVDICTHQIVKFQNSILKFSETRSTRPSDVLATEGVMICQIVEESESEENGAVRAEETQNRLGATEVVFLSQRLLMNEVGRCHYEI